MNLGVCDWACREGENNTYTNLWVWTILAEMRITILSSEDLRWQQSVKPANHQPQPEWRTNRAVNQTACPAVRH